MIRASVAAAGVCCACAKTELEASQTSMVIYAHPYIRSNACGKFASYLLPIEGSVPGLLS